MILSKEYPHTVFPGTNLISSAWLGSLPWEHLGEYDDRTEGDITIDPLFDVGVSWAGTNRQLEGQAYWVVNTGTTTITVSEQRPFKNPIVEDNNYPAILDISVSNLTATISMHLPSKGREAEKYTRYSKDTPVGRSVNLTKGWEAEKYALYSKDTPVGRSVNLTKGWGVLFEQIEGSGELLQVQDDVYSLVNSGASRTYLIVREDVDSDGDGISDAEEFFINQTDPLDAANSPGGDNHDPLAEYWKHIRYAQIIRFNEAYFSGDHVYVNRSIGRKEYDGLSPALRDGHGPKGQLEDAISSVGDKGTVHVNAGSYELEGPIKPRGTVRIKPEGGNRGGTLSVADYGVGGGGSLSASGTSSKREKACMNSPLTH